MKHHVISLAATLALCACGGGDGSAVDGRATIAAASQANPNATAQPIANFGPNAVSVWSEIGYRTAGNSTNQDFVTMHLAMYDAAMAVAHTHQPYAIRPTVVGAAGDVALNAAIIEAAYRTLLALFPNGGAVYETPHTDGLATLPDGTQKALGIAIGAQAAAGMVALRANDGRDTVLPPYVPGTLPGQFRGVNPVNRIAPYIRPFATLSHAQFRAPGPLVLTSSAYATDLAEVQSIAAVNSPLRTPAQTEAARFHTEPPPSFWSHNLKQFMTSQPTLAENARLAAMLWVALQDGSAGCFESKYHYNFWRPTSAINLADTDGNPATVADPTWAPVVPTPNHPEYPAAHGCVSGAVMEVVRDFYGSKKLRFAFTSNVSGGTHDYASTDDMLKDVQDGRVWGGMHFRTSVEDGQELGKQVAKWIAKHHFQPVQ